MSDSQDNIVERGSRNRRNSPSAHAVVHDKSGLYVAVLSAVLAGIAIGILITVPSLIDSKVAAGVAKAEATAQAAKEHARVALDKVEQTQVQLGAKGLVDPSTH